MITNGVLRMTLTLSALRFNELLRGAAQTRAAVQYANPRRADVARRGACWFPVISLQLSLAELITKPPNAGIERARIQRIKHSSFADEGYAIRAPLE